MIKRLKDIWSDPRDIQEAEWYILFGVFVMVWMWVILIMSPYRDRIEVTQPYF